MTTYQGGKKRIGKRIYRVIKMIENDLSETKQNYFEPFCGMCGVLRHFGKEDRIVTASDANIDLILLLRAAQKGWKPPIKCSENTWQKLKKSDIHSARRGFIGIAASWGGIFFQGYRLEYTNKRDYLREAATGLTKLAPDIKNVDFVESQSYEQFDPNDMLIYCDPPYKGNQLGLQKGLFRSFDHDKFWQIMRKWSKKNIVIISESIAPKDFKKIWSTQSHINNSDRYGTKKYPDNLYIHESLFEKISKQTRRDIKTV